MCIGKNLYRPFFVISLLRQTVYRHWHALWKCDEVLTWKLTVSHTAHGITKQYWWHVAGWSQKWGIPTRAQFPEAPERFFNVCCFVQHFSVFIYMLKIKTVFAELLCTTLHQSSWNTRNMEHTEHGTVRDNMIQHNVYVFCAERRLYTDYMWFTKGSLHIEPQTEV